MTNASDGKNSEMIAKLAHHFLGLNSYRTLVESILSHLLFSVLRQQDLYDQLMRSVCQIKLKPSAPISNFCRPL